MCLCGKHTYISFVTFKTYIHFHLSVFIFKFSRGISMPGLSSTGYILSVYSTHNFLTSLSLPIPSTQSFNLPVETLMSLQYYLTYWPGSPLLVSKIHLDPGKKGLRSFLAGLNMPSITNEKWRGTINILKRVCSLLFHYWWVVFFFCVMCLTLQLSALVRV